MGKRESGGRGEGKKSERERGEEELNWVGGECENREERGKGKEWEGGTGEKKGLRGESGRKRKYHHA